MPSVTLEAPAPETPDTLFVLDVESIGLHGEGFAVGFVVLHADGRILTERLMSCPPDAAADYPADNGAGRRWIAENGAPLEPQFPSPRDLRTAFWREWMVWQRCGALMLADCPWPVESRFLQACIDDLPHRAQHAPYPLMDVGSVLYAAGMDPIGTYDRKPDEKPPHDPLADARQSGRLLLEALQLLKERERRVAALESMRTGVLQILDEDRDPRVKLCHRCRFHDTGPGASLRCVHPLVNRRDAWALSRPEATHAGSECASERAKLWPFGACGRRGALWQRPDRWPRVP